jgi:2'-5' RNA ligase
MRIPPLGPGQVCLGVAVMVPPPLDERLRRIRRASGDPRPDDAPPHITVIPPTPVDRPSLRALIRRIAAQTARVERFEVRLRGAGTFRPVSPVVFAKVEGGFEACKALEAEVRRALDRLEDRFPYHPHVTVAQDAPDASLDQTEQAIAALDESFTVGAVEVCLLQSDAVWRPLSSCPLAGASS